MKHYLLLDTHGIGYAAQQANKLTVGDRQVQAIFGTLRKVRYCITRFNGVPFMLWDGKPAWRQELFAGYKLKRNEPSPQIKEMRDQFKQQKEDIKRGLQLLGVPNVIPHDGEADDLASMLSKRFGANPNNKTTLITRDGDWAQLVTDNVTFYDHHKDSFIQKASLMDLTGYVTPFALLQGKALSGDASDEIPGVGGIGEKGAVELIAEYGSVANLIQMMERGEVKKPKAAWKRLAANEFNEKVGMGALDCYKRNLKLMNLIELPETPQNIEIQKAKPDYEGFREFCYEMNFQSILRDFDLFIQPFQKVL